MYDPDGTAGKQPGKQRLDDFAVSQCLEERPRWAIEPLIRPSPVYPWVVAVPTMDGLRERRSEIESVARAHGASRVRVFGSVARGDATELSDLDLLVDLDEGRSLFDLGALLTDLRDLLGCEVDVATERSLRPRVAERVLADAVDL